jgi:hypothetical protein
MQLADKEDTTATADEPFHWTAEEERKVVRKTDRNLMPLLWVLFLVRPAFSLVNA